MVSVWFGGSLEMAWEPVIDRFESLGKFGDYWVKV